MLDSRHFWRLSSMLASALAAGGHGGVIGGAMRKEEGATEMKRLLTWRARFDEKSLNYRINKILPVSELPRKSMRWSCPVYFDQFEEPS